MGQLMYFQQVPEGHDRGVFGVRRTDGQACELTYWRDSYSASSILRATGSAQYVR
jgi:hypothetical protein